ncbi:hypothetical protein CE91St30_06400 [Raoultibacter timonensis]|uniref:Uncharacterized protein n=1 Tax=Raoultibacter timonensis TaxID=1907662 RepID=A0ABN6MEV6_9ACTN|nr:hypothetical protein CE91St30_06400 [Raoultibacter timonensis]BDF49910.1 hypothetical protein CE91St31_06400 [Raoultibacter timonensis]
MGSHGFRLLSVQVLAILAYREHAAKRGKAVVAVAEALGRVQFGWDADEFALSHAAIQDSRPLVDADAGYPR